MFMLEQEAVRNRKPNIAPVDRSCFEEASLA
jgi:hypothetical protein